MTRVLVGIACVGVGVLALLVARDAWRIDKAIHDGDARASVSARGVSWNAGTAIPFALVRKGLGVDDDLEYRALVARAVELSGRTAETPAEFRARAPVETALQRVKSSDQSARRRSDAANLLGLMILGDPQDAETSPLETPFQRAVREFRFAVRVDPSNDAAKTNLELMLQSQRSENPQGQGSTGGGSEAGQGAAGLGIPGYGF